MCALSCTPVAAHGGLVDSNRLVDGKYEGSASHLDSATVAIVVRDHRIVAVTVETFNATRFGSKARDVIPARIVEKQSTRVDVVSGATEASNVIMNAAEDAVHKSYAARP
jgi:uncharacterized protein with FMN-binding domain